MKLGNIEIYGVIYKITNLVNHKVYIGQTIQGFDKRYSGRLENRIHNKYLSRSIKKYGIENFEIIKIYDVAFSKEELDIKEKHYIQLFDSFNNGYNLDLGGSGRTFISDEERMMISNRMVGSKNPNFGNIGWRHNDIICINTNEIFKTAKEANEKYKECHCGGNSKILCCCKHQRKSAGKLNGIPLVWMYYEEYLKLNKEEIERYINNSLTIDRSERTILYKVIDTKGNKTVLHGKEIYNKGSNGFLNINEESFKKYIMPFEEINTNNIPINFHTKNLIEKLKPYNGWKIIKL